MHLLLRPPARRSSPTYRLTSPSPIFPSFTRSQPSRATKGERVRSVTALRRSWRGGWTTSVIASVAGCHTRVRRSSSAHLSFSPRLTASCAWSSASRSLRRDAGRTSLPSSARKRCRRRRRRASHLRRGGGKVCRHLVASSSPTRWRRRASSLRRYAPWRRTRWVRARPSPTSPSCYTPSSPLYPRTRTSHRSSLTFRTRVRAQYGVRSRRRSVTAPSSRGTPTSYAAFAPWAVVLRLARVGCDAIYSCPS